MPDEFFQPWFVQLISILSDLFTGFSAIGVVILAWWGFKQWRIELEGRARFEIARRLATLAFQFADEFERARNGGVFLEEPARRSEKEGETLEETRLLNQHFKRREKLLPLRETLRKLYEAAWEIEAITDEEIIKLIEPLENAYKRLDRAIKIYFSTKLKLQMERQENQTDYTFRDFLVESDELEPYHRIIYGFDDEMSQWVHAAVNALSDQMKIIIEKNPH